MKNKKIRSEKNIIQRKNQHWMFLAIKWLKKIEADHILPESRGGGNSIQNAIPLSKISNEQKSNKMSGVINDKSFKVKRIFPKQGTLYINGKKISK